MNAKKRYRLITRSDMDGLICAVLLNKLDLINEILFAHPKDMQDGKVAVTSNDIITNLPFVPGAHLVIDHHYSETLRTQQQPNHVIDPSAPSAARVVYNHFGGSKCFPAEFDDMMAAVDKADSGQFTREDILSPKGWVLLSFVMDGRTGLGRYEFEIPHDQLMMDLIDYCSRLSIDEILALPEVRARTNFYFDCEQRYCRQLERCSELHDNLVVVDGRKESLFYPGNRFMIYILYPSANISLRITDGRRPGTTVFAVGKSIFNRTSKTNVGALMLQYGGGGHAAAGTCQIPNDQAQEVLEALIEAITQAG